MWRNFNVQLYTDLVKVSQLPNSNYLCTCTSIYSYYHPFLSVEYKLRTAIDVNFTMIYHTFPYPILHRKLEYYYLLLVLAQITNKGFDSSMKYQHQYYKRKRGNCSSQKTRKRFAQTLLLNWVETWRFLAGWYKKDKLRALSFRIFDLGL